MGFIRQHLAGSRRIIYRRSANCYESMRAGDGTIADRLYRGHGRGHDHEEVFSFYTGIYTRIQLGTGGPFHSQDSAAAPFLQSEYMVYVVGAICILLGLHFMDLFHIPVPISQDQLPMCTGFVGAAMFGFMFGLVSLPCTGPALLLIVSVIPLKGAFFGGIMMLFYGIGHCLLRFSLSGELGWGRQTFTRIAEDAFCKPGGQKGSRCPIGLCRALHRGGNTFSRVGLGIVISPKRK